MLAAASVSLAMSRGTDIARTSADAILLSDRLECLPGAVDVAAKTLRIIRQNLAWAFAYNFTALPLAMLGYVTPWMAALGMAGTLFSWWRMLASRANRSCAFEAGAMEILYLLIPLSIALVFLIGGIFWWAIKSGQFDDLEGPAHRILLDDETPPRRKRIEPAKMEP